MNRIIGNGIICVTGIASHKFRWSPDFPSTLRTLLPGRLRSHKTMLNIAVLAGLSVSDGIFMISL
jgi:hypothetical protein